MSSTKNAKAQTNNSKPGLVKAFLKTDTKTLREASGIIMAELARRTGKKAAANDQANATTEHEGTGRRRTNLQNLAVGDMVVYRDKGKNEGRIGRLTRLGQVRGDVRFDGDRTDTRYLDLTALLRCQSAEVPAAAAVKPRKVANAR